MSDIIIEGKNLNEIDQSNFQSVGPYVENGSIAVYEPWQGREIDFQGNDTDGRFSLGTITENNRDFWEVQTTNKITRKSQFDSKRIRTARATLDPNNNLVISDEVRWSVDTFPFNFNQEGETTPLYFYYDEKLHPKEYENASSSTVSFRIELRESGRQNGIMDNFLLREPFRPFIIGLQAESYDSSTDPGGFVSGDGAFKLNDDVEVLAEPFDITHFVRWVDGETEEEISLDNPYFFSMPKSNVQLIGKFNTNPIIHVASKTPTLPSRANQAAKFYLNTTEYTNNLFAFADDDEPMPPTDEVHSHIKFLPDSAFYLGEELQKFRPGTDMDVLFQTQGDEFEFEKYTIVNQNGEEEDIPDETDYVNAETYQVGKFTIPSALSLEQNPFPDNIIQIYAYFNVLLVYIRSFNDWIATQPQGQTEAHRLIWGYGGVGEDSSYKSGDWVQKSVDTEISINLKTDGFGGYRTENWITSGSQFGDPDLFNPNAGTDYFWYQLPSGSSGPTSDIVNVINDFDETLLRTVSDNDDDYWSNGSTITVPRDSLGYSPSIPLNERVGHQIAGIAGNYTYIGRFFKQEGTYVKITKTDDSHDFDITPPPSTSVIRAKENSPELDANMYHIGQNLLWNFTPNTVHLDGEVGEMPEIQAVRGWDNISRNFEIYPSSNVPLSSVFASLGITYEQEGEFMRLRYPLPDSLEDNLYLKYLEFIVKSTIVPPPIAPFNGIFEINFSNANASVATLSFSQEDGETPQTTLIGQHGEDAGQFGVETPTYAITVDDWINGATVGILPVPLEINYNSNVNPNDVTQLPTQIYFTSATADAIDELLEVVQPTNQYNEQTKNMIKENLLGTGNDPYLQLSVFNNLLNIEKTSQNEFIEEFLRGIEQDNSLPRIPITVVSNFTQTFNISIQALNFFALPDGEYPTRFITNWNQAAYDANSSPSAADTWIDDDLLLIQESEMFTSDDIVNITVPASFFNGSRVLKIRQVITQQSGASAGPEILQSGGSATITSNESSTYDWTNRITAVEGSVELTISWVGNF